MRWTIPILLVTLILCVAAPVACKVYEYHSPSEGFKIVVEYPTTLKANKTYTINYTITPLTPGVFEVKALILHGLEVEEITVFEGKYLNETYSGNITFKTGIPNLTEQYILVLIVGVVNDGTRATVNGTVTYYTKTFIIPLGIVEGKLIGEYEDEVRKLSSRVKTLEGEIAELEEEYGELKEEYGKLKEEYAEAKIKVGRLIEELNNAKNKIIALQGENARLKAENEKLKGEIAILERKVEAGRQIVESLLREKETYKTIAYVEAAAITALIICVVGLALARKSRGE